MYLIDKTPKYFSAKWLKELQQNKSGLLYCLLTVWFSSPAALQLLLELLSGAVERNEKQLTKHKGKTAVKIYTSGIDLHLRGAGHTFTMISIMILKISKDGSIPISLVAHVAVSPQQALLSEKEQIEG